MARRAFKEFYAQCFWSYREDLEITEEFIPFVFVACAHTAAWPAIAWLLAYADVRVLRQTSFAVARHFGSLKGALPRIVP